MDDEKEMLDNDLRMAASCSQLLNNEVFVGAMMVRKAQLFDQFCKTEPDQSDVRDEVWRTMQNLDSLENYFQTVIQSGRIAEEKIADQLTEDF